LLMRKHLVGCKYTISHKKTTTPFILISIVEDTHISSPLLI
jgi:hypothetical protein